MAPVRFPNESADYRAARDLLLKEEMELRSHIERVARQRRALPPGGLLKEDYVFDERVDGRECTTRFSELFAPQKDTLFLYSFMYAPDMSAPCPMCTSFLDGLHGQIVHLEPRINVAVVAKHALDSIHAHAAARGWTRFRLLSSATNSYNVDYFGERDGAQWTMANVFVKRGGEIRHFWGTEMTYADPIEGGNMRHLDLAWPMWNVLDMTPGGRGEKFYPALSYV
jgi:predicted dithiol-disulfide oxidoreductase (DUF899 family)